MALRPPLWRLSGQSSIVEVSLPTTEGPATSSCHLYPPGRPTVPLWAANWFVSRDFATSQHLSLGHHPADRSATLWACARSSEAGRPKVTEGSHNGRDTDAVAWQRQAKVRAVMLCTTRGRGLRQRCKPSPTAEGCGEPGSRLLCHRRLCHRGELPMRLQLRDKVSPEFSADRSGVSPKAVRHELRDIARLPQASAG